MQAGALSMLAGVALVAVVAALAPAILRVRGPGAYLLAALTVAAADVVAVSTALSLVDRFTDGWLLAGHATVAAVVAGLWVVAGRPAPPVSAVARVRRADVAAAFRREPLVGGFAVVVALALVVQLFQGLTVVTNSWDPMAYHLSRAAHWVQQQSVAYFEGGNARQLGYPPNGELLHAWTMALSGRDAFVNVVQWVALLGSGAGVMLGARLLRFGRAASVLAGLLFMAMPIPILQAATAQNDLILTCFVAAGVVLGARGLRDGRLGEATVGAMGIALALGTKGIVVVAGPSIALIAALVLWRSPAARRMLPAAAAVFAVAIATLAAYWFVLNLQETGSLYGDAREGIERTSSLAENTGRVWWGFVDAPGTIVPWVQTWTDRVAGDVLGTEGGRSYAPDVYPHEAHSAFGLVGLLVLFPIVVLTAVRRRSPLDRRVVAIATLLFFLLFPLSAQDDPSLARLGATGILLGAPLLAVVHARRGAAAAAVVLAVLGLAACVLDNPLRPLVVARGQEPAYALGRMEQFELNRPDMRGALVRTDALLAPDARIAFVGGHSGYEYPLFGPRLGRRITRMTDASALTIEAMRRRGLQAAVVDGYDGAQPPPGLRAIQVAERWWVVLPERSGVRDRG